MITIPWEAAGVGLEAMPAATGRFRHAQIASTFGGELFSGNAKPSIMDGTAVMADAMLKAQERDKAFASQLLTAQAMTIDVLFTDMARRSGNNMGQYIDAAERYMRLALKAQAPCRATLEALAKLHKPRERTVKHVHVNEGGQAIVADQFHQHQIKLAGDRVEAFGKTVSADQSEQPERLRRHT